MEPKGTSFISILSLIFSEFVKSAMLSDPQLLALKITKVTKSVFLTDVIVVQQNYQKDQEN
tara:strand:+ start:893 stop:1075 length:183 start_codon:yes stop_codon:yes gene_type:complete